MPTHGKQLLVLLVLVFLFAVPWNSAMSKKNNPSARCYAGALQTWSSVLTEVCQASNSTPLCTWGTWSSQRWSNLPALQRVSDRAGIFFKSNQQLGLISKPVFLSLNWEIVREQCGEQREGPSGIATCSLGQSHNLLTSFTFQLWMCLLFGLSLQ